MSVTDDLLWDEEESDYISDLMRRPCVLIIGRKPQRECYITMSDDRTDLRNRIKKSSKWLAEAKKVGDN